MAKRKVINLDKNASSSFSRKERPGLDSSPEENDWTSVIVTPSKPRSKRFVDNGDAKPFFKAKDRPLRDLVNSRLHKPEPNPCEDLDAPELDHLGDRTLDSPLPRTPPRRMGNRYPFLQPQTNSPPSFPFHQAHSSPRVTLAYIRDDIPLRSLSTSISADNWLCDGELSTQRKKRSLDGKGADFLLGLGLTLTKSCDSISSMDRIADEDFEDKDIPPGPDLERLLFGSPHWSCSTLASTPTPSLA